MFHEIKISLVLFQEGYFEQLKNVTKQRENPDISLLDVISRDGPAISYPLLLNLRQLSSLVDA